MFSAFVMVMVIISSRLLPGACILRQVSSKAMVGTPLSSVHAKLPRLYLPQTIALGTQLQVPRDDAHYIFNVMRLKSGSSVRIFNEREGDFIAKLASSSGPRDKQVSLEVSEKLMVPAAHKHILPCAIFIAPIKKTRMKILLEKAAELGVQHIIPVNTQNTQHTIEGSSMEQYRRMLIQSCEQCERLTLPMLHHSISMDDFIIWRSTGTDSGETVGFSKNIKYDIPVLVCAERIETGSAASLDVGTGGKKVSRPLLTAVQEQLQSAQQSTNDCADALAHVDAVDSSALVERRPHFAIMVGPEGGFTASELNVLAAQRCSQLVTLGSSVLRAETAAICALSTVASAVQDRDYRTSYPV